MIANEIIPSPTVCGGWKGSGWKRYTFHLCGNQHWMKWKYTHVFFVRPYTLLCKISFIHNMCVYPFTSCFSFASKSENIPWWWNGETNSIWDFSQLVQLLVLKLSIVSVIHILSESVENSIYFPYLSLDFYGNTFPRWGAFSNHFSLFYFHRYMFMLWMDNSLCIFNYCQDFHLTPGEDMSAPSPHLTLTYSHTGCFY